MKFLEKDLEEIIYEASYEELESKRLWMIYGVKKRQLRIGSYGVADIVSFSRRHHQCIATGKITPYLHIVVCELKKDKAGISAFLQAIRYCKGIKRYMEKNKPNIPFKFDIVLIGNKIDTHSDYVFISDLISGDDFGFISDIYNISYSYGFNGISFKNHFNYCLTNERF